MLINFEVPNRLLGEFKNNFEFAKAHLFKDDPIYETYFKTALHNGKTVVLDCSTKDFGEHMHAKDYRAIADNLFKSGKGELLIICPDIPNDGHRNCQQFDAFKPKGKKVGVVHGKDREEAMKCFDHITKGFDTVAIPAELDFYNEYEGKTTGQKCSSARSKFIHDLYSNGKLKNTKIILLGVTLPQELELYENIPEVIMAVTSQPVSLAFENKNYKSYGLDDKPKRINDFYIKDLNKENKNDLSIFNNIIINIRDFNLITHNLKIEKATRDEIEYYIEQIDKVKYKQTAEFSNSILDFETYALKHNNKIVGFVAGRHYETIEGGDGFKIHFLHIDEEFRGLKLSKLLLRKICFNKKNIVFIANSLTNGVNLFKNIPAENVKISRSVRGGEDIYYYIDGVFED